MAINVEEADQYFAEDKHVLFAQWKRFSEKQKAAAIVLGKNVVKNAIGRVLYDETTTTEENPLPRYDAAVYEQAVFALTKCNVIPSEANPTPQELFPDKKKKGSAVAYADPYRLCPAACGMITRSPARIMSSK